MMLGDEIAHYLASASLGLTFGSTAPNGVWSIPFPTIADDTATCVIPYGPGEPIDAFGDSLAASILECARFQVVCRDSQDNGLACVTLANSVFKKLRHFSGSIGSTPVRYGFIKALSSVFFLKYDTENRVYYACDFEAYKAESS